MACLSFIGGGEIDGRGRARARLGFEMRTAARVLVGTGAADRVWDPGDDRLSRDCTIMGPAGLTAVFGMGTGVAPPVWSPRKRSAGTFNPAGRVSGMDWSIRGRVSPISSAYSTHVTNDLFGSGSVRNLDRVRATQSGSFRDSGSASRVSKGPDRGGQAAWLLGPVG